ncbi:uncharacterized protein LOC131955143 [Physella acuta]|uniref:uncharacterized protein LOC131955143 n=1 Tax=Physella acuta TaxID=109671 RepID=UPI0027DCA978|nr:uncharacterized protein LOC131955143 [Physella acuta]
MKEANEGRVVLHDISVSTFQLILKTLYTGEDVLSLDNFIEIWQAVDMLQIGFLVELCETFADKQINVDNFKEIVFSAKLLNSKSALTTVNNFMIHNFKEVYEKKLYLDLSFEELYTLLESRELNASNEYLVLKTILNWSEYKPAVHVPDEFGITANQNKKIKSEKSSHNIIAAVIHEPSLEDKSTIVNDKGTSNLSENNKESSQSKSKKTLQDDSCNSNSSISQNESNVKLHRLEDLLKRVRICTISPALLANVLEHQCIKLNDKAKQIIHSAILNQTIYFKHGQWPTAGTYREPHEFGNYGVCSLYGNGTFEALDPYDEKWYKMKTCESLRRNVQLVAFDHELYAIGLVLNSQIKSHMFVYGNDWKHIAELPGIEFYLASNENHIYFTSVAEKVIYRIDPKHVDVNFVKFTEIPEGAVVTHVMSYQIYLLIFCNETVNGVEETAVHVLELPAKSWTRLDNLNGPAKNIISFRNDDNHFVLQTNGNLWALNQTDGLFTFNHLTTLWTLDHVIPLYGAVIYGEKLVILYYNPDEADYTLLKKVDNMFSSIRYWYTDKPCSNFIPAVLPKSYLHELVDDE